MIETLLLITGAIVWVIVAIVVASWLPPAIAFAIGWIFYKIRRQLWIRDKCVSFVLWYTDHILKPMYDPIVG